MNWIKRIFRQPVYPRQADIQTEYAFSLNGVDYFCCTDFLNMPIKRAEKASVFYEELKANIDFDYLKWITKEIDEQLNKGSLTGVANLNRLLSERLTLAPDPQLLLKLSTVVFFDANENMHDYDFKYNEKKRQIFLKEGVDVFFCTMPMGRLIPHIDMSKLDSTQMREASLATVARTIQLIDTLLAGESIKGSTEASRNELLSQRQQALALLESEGLDYTNIIYSLNVLKAQNNAETGHKDQI